MSQDKKLSRYIIKIKNIIDGLAHLIIIGIYLRRIPFRNIGSKDVKRKPSNK